MRQSSENLQTERRTDWRTDGRTNRAYFIGSLGRGWGSNKYMELNNILWLEIDIFPFKKCPGEWHSPPPYFSNKSDSGKSTSSKSSANTLISGRIFHPTNGIKVQYLFLLWNFFRVGICSITFVRTIVFQDN